MLDVIYRDEALIAVHKPSGLLVHRSMLDRHETRFALQLVRDQIGRRVYPVHRLDKGTSGVLLFALDPEAAAILGQAFGQRQVFKRYLAVVRGHPNTGGVIDYPLIRTRDESGANTSDVPEEARDAITTWRRLATAEINQRVDRYPTSRYALLELRPETGRRHQLRRHLKHISHPIIGDATHGKGRHNRLFTDLFGTDRLLLACTGMGFIHPVDNVRLDLVCPPSDDFMRVIEGFGWRQAVLDALPLPAYS